MGLIGASITFVALRIAINLAACQVMFVAKCRKGNCLRSFFLGDKQHILPFCVCAEALFLPDIEAGGRNTNIFKSSIFLVLPQRYKMLI